MEEELPPGLIYLPNYLDGNAQISLLNTLRDHIRKNPLFVPRMPRSGKPMSVRMTNFGALGWVTDKEHGYRYQSHHPETGNPWPNIPDALLRLWDEVSKFPKPPDACLLNHYEINAKMGLHVDNDEEDLSAPVVSVSLGDTCLFRYGGLQRNDPTRSFKLESGDVVMLSGEARLIYHGVDRVYSGTSELLKNGGRVNLTMRKVT